MDKSRQNIDLDIVTKFLAGEANREEQDYVQFWIAASEENKTLFKEFSDAWQALDKTSPTQNINVDNEWLHLQKTIGKSVQKTSRVIPFKTFLKYAATILLLIGVSYLSWIFFSQKSIETDVAETNEVKLPDGSHVTLNAGSKLNYDHNYGNKERIVKLTGEAYFKVTKNAKVPFIVKLGEAEVKVLGTSFNVKAYKGLEKVEVTVAEGTVSVYKSNDEPKRVVITKGEKAIYYKQLQTVSKQQNEDRNFISWKTKQIVFENDSISAIAATLSNVYHVEIVIQNPELNSCTLTTSFEDKDLITVLKVLKSTLNVAVEVKEGKIYIKGKGC